MKNSPKYDTKQNVANVAGTDTVNDNKGFL